MEGGYRRIVPDREVFAAARRDLAAQSPRADFPFCSLKERGEGSRFDQSLDRRIRREREKVVSNTDPS
jgi:hypothetical protein